MRKEDEGEDFAGDVDGNDGDVGKDNREEDEITVVVLRVMGVVVVMMKMNMMIMVLLLFSSIIEYLPDLIVRGPNNHSRWSCSNSSTSAPGFGWYEQIVTQNPGWKSSILQDDDLENLL